MESKIALGVLAGLTLATFLGVGYSIFQQDRIRTDFRDTSPKPLKITHSSPLSIEAPMIRAKFKFTRGGNNVTLEFTGASWAALIALVEDAKDGLEAIWGTGVTYEVVNV